MWLRTHCDLAFELSVPTAFILMLRPRSGADQWVAGERYEVRPEVDIAEYADGFGNLGQRLVAPAGRFEVRCSADVRVRGEAVRAPAAPFVPVQQLPESVLTYLLPSRYCESEQFHQLAHEIVGDAAPGYDQVARISEWVREQVRFDPQSPHFQQSAAQVNGSRVGVCRELAHIGIALCRALCIPARMAVGYLHRLEPMDLHAWFEAYVGDGWYVFDPTQAQWRGGRVTIGRGRDAADVAIFNQFGPLARLERMHVGVEPVDAGPRGARA